MLDFPELLGPTRNVNGRRGRRPVSERLLKLWMAKLEIITGLRLDGKLPDYISALVRIGVIQNRRLLSVAPQGQAAECFAYRHSRTNPMPASIRTYVHTQSGLTLMNRAPE